VGIALSARLGLAFVASVASLASLASLASVMSGCASAPANAGRYPPRPDGCDVKIYPEAPVAAIDNIGPVNASCGADVTNEECLRTLQDEACKLGADLVWGVADEPVMKVGKKKLAGRAAHTKTASK
jgi:hypothetical protein